MSFINVDETFQLPKIWLSLGGELLSAYKNVTGERIKAS